MEKDLSASVCREVLSLACARISRRLRIQKKWTQEDLAVRSGICQSYISNIEQGKHLISLEKLCTLTEAFEIDLQVCFGYLAKEIGTLMKLREFYLNNYEIFINYRDFGELIRRNINKENLDLDLYL